MKLQLELQLEWLPMSCISTDCMTQSHASVCLIMSTIFTTGNDQFIIDVQQVEEMTWW